MKAGKRSQRKKQNILLNLAMAVCVTGIIALSAFLLKITFFEKITLQVGERIMTAQQWKSGKKTNKKNKVNQEKETASSGETAKQEEIDGYLLFIGDSRTVQMSVAVEYDESDCYFVAEPGMGYDWFKSEGIWDAEARIRDRQTDIVLNLGVNDVMDAELYADLIKKHLPSWLQRGCKVFYVSVNPVSGYPTLTNEEIQDFNKELKSLLPKEVTWIDSYSYLMQTGYRTLDGLHYDDATYQKIFSFLKTTIAPLD